MLIDTDERSFIDISEDRFSFGNNVTNGLSSVEMLNWEGSRLKKKHLGACFDSVDLMIVTGLGEALEREPPVLVRLHVKRKQTLVLVSLPFAFEGKQREAC